jgi:hypothetical protein
MVRAACLYCGAPLGPELVEAAAAAAEAQALEAAAPPPPPRDVVVLDLRQSTPAALSGALGLSSFDAEQRLRRGGYQLHRIADPPAAREEADRLRAAGLSAWLVPEDEARTAAAPLLAVGGAWDGQALALRGVDAARAVRREELLLVVRGPIARQLEAPLGQFKHVRLAGPGEGHRIHLHLRAEARPLEIDPDDFELGDAAAQGATRATLLGWLRELADGVTVDEGFRALAPALGPAQPPLPGPAQALGPARSGKGPRPALFDNVAQFRFYSGWRAAVERRARS